MWWLIASVLIHLAVAKQISKKINKSTYDYYLGSIAPDISKQIGENKIKSHFQKSNDDLPVLDDFLKKYSLNNDFYIGYYVHLYTDYLWFKYFMKEINYNNVITLINGEKQKLSEQQFVTLLYNDYTTLNIQIIDEYNLDLKLFYEEFKCPKITMDEIPIQKLNILIDKMSIIIENSKSTKEYLFNIENINKFIETSTEIISSDIIKKISEKV